MKTDIYVGTKAIQAWHLRLADALERIEGIEVTLKATGTDEPFPTSIRLLLMLEGLTQSGLRQSPLDDLTGAVPSHLLHDKGPPDLIIDLRDPPAMRATGPRCLVPRFDRRPGSQALLLALLERRAPWITITDSSHNSPINVGLPALESAHAVSAGAGSVLARLIEALARAATAVRDGKEIPASASLPQLLDATQTPASVPRFLAERLTLAARNALDHLLSTAPQWSVAWRRAPARPAPRSEVLEPVDYIHLPRTHDRYWADPFVMFRDGVHHVFVEEFPYATRRGIISHFTISADGTASKPEPVLEEAHHLSYPHIFEHDGAIWMLPEAAESGALELYRAERFPDRWTSAGRIIESRVHDATLAEHDGLLWIFATVETELSSTWDGLGLFTAPRLRGPWTRHPLSPALVDARAARPAGALFQHDGCLYRTAQDCSSGYGSALTYAKIRTLGADDYAQAPAGRISFHPASGILGPHTWNWAGGLEVIDLYSRRGALTGAASPRRPISL